MERIDRHEALRTRFMNELFELANGSRNKPVVTREVADRLGLVFEHGKDREEVCDIADYLKDEGLISIETEEVTSVRLTHRGIREVEQARRQPDEPTQNLGAINTINNYFHVERGSVNAPIQQGSPGATQSLTVIGEDHKQHLEGIVRSLRSSIDDLELGDEDRAELEADVRTLEAQVASPKPKKEIVHPSLQSAKNILEGTASGAAAQGIIAGIGLFLGA
jgi:hypothetical protein